MTYRSASSPSRLAALALFATAAGLACASSRDTATGAATAAYAKPKTAPFDLALRQLIDASDEDLPHVATALGVTTPERVDGVRWYRVLVVLEVGTALEPLVDRPGLELRSHLGRVLSLRLTGDALASLGREPGVVAVQAARRVRAVNEVGSSVSSGTKVSVPVGGALDTPMPVEAGKSYVFALGAKGPKPNGADPVLTLCRDSACTGPSLVASDSDSGPGTDARLAFTATATETLILRATDASGLAMTDSLTAIGSSALPNRLGTGARGLWSQGLRGDGALVAVIDSGVDFCHDDFTTVDGAGARQSRLVTLWDENLTIRGQEHRPTFTHPGGLASGGYGVEWTQGELSAALTNCDSVRSVDDDGHGTHVLGTAAGNGRGGPDQRYAGAAPDAGIIGVATTFDDAGIMDGVAYAIAIAEREHKPVSINLSIGSHGGPHDGTEAFSLAMLAAAGPGRSIVLAAGNEGDAPIFGASASPAPAVDNLVVSVANGTRAARDGALFLWTDIDDDWRITVIDPGGNVVGSAEPGDSRTFTYQGMSVQLISDRTPYDTNPTLRQAAFVVESWALGATRFTLRFERLRGTGSGRWWGWSVPDSPAAISFVDHRSQAGDGGYLGTINDMATSDAVLAVGASTSLVRVKKADGNPESDASAWASFGSIAKFSSRGPSRDDRVKPDLVAPGMWIISTLSRSTTQPNTVVETSKHQKMQGTSMATPAITGVAAQLLASDPTIIPNPLLANTAVKDAAVMALDQGSAATWGNGKADAVAAYTRLLADAAPSATFREARRDGFRKAHLAVDVSDADGATDLAYVLWDVDGDGANDALTHTPALEMPMGGLGPFTARAVVVDKSGKTAVVTAPVVDEPLIDAGVDAGRDAGRDAGVLDAADAAVEVDAAPELDAAPVSPEVFGPVLLAPADNGCTMHPSSRRATFGPWAVLGSLVAAATLRRRRPRG